MLDSVDPKSNWSAIMDKARHIKDGTEMITSEKNKWHLWWNCHSPTILMWGIQYLIENLHKNNSYQCSFSFFSLSPTGQKMFTSKSECKKKICYLIQKKYVKNLRQLWREIVPEKWFTHFQFNIISKLNLPNYILTAEKISHWFYIQMIKCNILKWK